VKLFQIEEPDGFPQDDDMPGAAIGIDATGRLAEIAFAVGGNALILTDREGFERDIPVPPLDAGAAAWQELFEWARVRAARALARPVTHAVLGLAHRPDAAALAAIEEAAKQAGLELLRISEPDTKSATGSAALALATLAEDTAPRPAS
jgi:hypothetical protein